MDEVVTVGRSLSEEYAVRILRLMDQVNALADEIQQLRAEEVEHHLILDDTVKDLRTIARKAGRA
jgi:demethoxyubiquinone hydroxylase (CLK1/Coq7/Cat5 family)